MWRVCIILPSFSLVLCSHYFPPHSVSILCLALPALSPLFLSLCSAVLSDVCGDDGGSHGNRDVAHCQCHKLCRIERQGRCNLCASPFASASKSMHDLCVQIEHRLRSGVVSPTGLLRACHRYIPPLTGQSPDCDGHIGLPATRWSTASASRSQRSTRSSANAWPLRAARRQGLRRAHRRAHPDHLARQGP